MDAEAFSPNEFWLNGSAGGAAAVIVCVEIVLLLLIVWVLVVYELMWSVDVPIVEWCTVNCCWIWWRWYRSWLVAVEVDINDVVIVAVGTVFIWLLFVVCDVDSGVIVEIGAKLIWLTFVNFNDLSDPTVRF